MKKKPKQVLLLVESSRAYGRTCLLGVADYLRSHGGWHVLNIERGLTDRLPSYVATWRGDGVISRIENVETLDAVAALGVATVDLRGSYVPSGGASFDTDPDLVGKLAADHFLQSGFTDFAFCGFPGIDFSEKRGRAFCGYLRTRGHVAISYSPDHADASPADVLTCEARGEFEGAYIASWLQTLPRPVAVFACNDVRARQVIEACHSARITVPDEVSVLGVDNDEVICELSSPPLSTIRPDAFRIGYEGAAMLDALMDGAPPPAEPILIPPRGIERRLSSEATAVSDRPIALAMRMIRESACDGIFVEDLVRRLPMSRSTLERRFQNAFSRSPAAEIERVRMSRARLLLAKTRYRLAKIAEMTGYGSAAQFAAAFKRSEGMTAGQYRSRCLSAANESLKASP